MKKSVLVLFSLVLTAGVAARGVVMADESAPAVEANGASSSPAPAAAAPLPSLAAPDSAPLSLPVATQPVAPQASPILESSVPPQNMFLAPGSSTGTFSSAADANVQLNRNSGVVEMPSTYGPGSNTSPNGSSAGADPRAMGPANVPQPDSNRAGRVLNNSLNGDWFNYCGPEGRSCCSQIYGAVDVWALDRKDATFHIVAVNATNTSIALSTSEPNFRWDKATPRITLGRLFCDWAIEGSVIYKDDISAHVDAVSTVGNTAVFFGAQPATSNYTAATHMRLDLYDGFHSYELNAIDTRSFFQMIYGFRYIEFREQLAVRSTAATGTSDAALGTYNRMFGGQVGVRMDYVGAMYDFQFNLKGGMYQNDANFGTNITDINNTTVVRRTHRDGQNEAYLAEMNLMLTYRMTNSIKMRLGYQLMYISNLALAADQISPVQTAAGNQTGFDMNSKGEQFMRGIVAGFEYRW
ncbi:MAG: BBP7 family outer membrane beta-barrel protein [Planctomycetia bacterium]|nr:BBP7 family outer membrane beta-barrel protein [Planctomycetia bacterium]